MIPIFLLLILALMVPVGAQTDEDKLSEIENEIDALSREIKAQEQIKDQRAAQVAEVAARLEALRLQVIEAQARVDAKEADIARQEAELTDLERTLASLEEQIARTRLEVRQTKELVQERAVAKWRM
jgi:septal ring factor EnvC (AmiA/AmiB activator)